MGLVTSPCDLHSADTDASRNMKNFIGSTNGRLTSFLGIPYAKPPCASLITARPYCVLTSVQYRKQTFQPS
jgi:carboxylesterase type B